MRLVILFIKMCHNKTIQNLPEASWLHNSVDALAKKALEEVQLVENNTTKTVSGPRGISFCVPHDYSNPLIREY